MPRRLIEAPDLKKGKKARRLIEAPDLKGKQSSEKPVQKADDTDAIRKHVETELANARKEITNLLKVIDIKRVSSLQQQMNSQLSDLTDRLNQADSKLKELDAEIKKPVDDDRMIHVLEIMQPVRENVDNLMAEAANIKEQLVNVEKLARTRRARFQSTVTKESITAAISTHAGEADPHTGYALKSLFDAYSILIADSDDIPTALTLAASRIPARLASGGIVAATPAQILAILSGQAGAAFDLNNKILSGVNSIYLGSDALLYDLLGIIYLRNAADSAYQSLYLGTLVFNTALTAGANALSINAKGTNNNYLKFQAKDTEGGFLEIGRLAGASDPYFAFGGSQQWKFYNSGVVDFNNLTGILRADSGAVSVDTTALLKDGSVALAGNLDFAEYKAIALVCDNGSTVPAAPTKGQWFLHTPTGRTVLLIYDGSNWIPIISLGTMTVYVDGTDGTDSIDYGGAVDAGAFKTVQYVINAIPGTITGNVVIYIAAGTYSETVTIRGKVPTGDYTIKIYGTLTESASSTAESKVAGTGATQGTLTDTGAFGSYDNKLVYITAKDEYRIIDSDTADVITIVGTFTDATNLAYKIYDWGTIVTKFFIYNGFCDVYLYDMSIPGTSSFSVYVDLNSSGRVYRCNCAMRVTALTMSFIQVAYSYVAMTASYTIQVVGSARCLFDYSKAVTSSASGIVLSCSDVSLVQIRRGSILDGASGATAVGFEVFNAAAGKTTETAGNGYIRIRNCNIGISSYQGGQVTGTANNQYSGNTADESATAASYGYID